MSFHKRSSLPEGKVYFFLLGWGVWEGGGECPCPIRSKSEVNVLHENAGGGGGKEETFSSNLKPNLYIIFTGEEDDKSSVLWGFSGHDHKLSQRVR